MRLPHREPPPCYSESPHYTSAKLIVIVFDAHVARLQRHRAKKARSMVGYLSTLRHVKGLCGLRRRLPRISLENWLDEKGGQSGCLADGMRGWDEVRQSRLT